MTFEEAEFCFGIHGPDGVQRRQRREYSPLVQPITDASGLFAFPVYAAVVCGGSFSLEAPDEDAVFHGLSGWEVQFGSSGPADRRGEYLDLVVWAQSFGQHAAMRFRASENSFSVAENGERYLFCHFTGGL
ncbi:MAG: hypothetical protein V8Q54_06025 [Alistipes senegalensis]